MITVALSSSPGLRQYVTALPSNPGIGLNDHALHLPAPKHQDQHRPPATKPMCSHDDVEYRYDRRLISWILLVNVLQSRWLDRLFARELRMSQTSDCLLRRSQTMALERGVGQIPRLRMVSGLHGGSWDWVVERGGWDEEIGYIGDREKVDQGTRWMKLVGRGNVQSIVPFLSLSASLIISSISASVRSSPSDFMTCLSSSAEMVPEPSLSKTGMAH